MFFCVGVSCILHFQLSYDNGYFEVLPACFFPCVVSSSNDCEEVQLFGMRSFKVGCMFLVHGDHMFELLPADIFSYAHSMVHW